MSSSEEYDDGDTVILQSSDGQEFSVSKEVAEMSNTIKHMLGDLSRSMDASSAPIPLPNINSTNLEKVIDYLNHHLLHPVPDRDDGDYRLDNITDWDEDFIDVDIEMLFDLILAANFLDIKSLLDLGCKTVAKMIIGKTPDEIEKTFRIPD
eukprot:TRINITY_DN12085_c0_g1_i1.p1 TRINITY_DN12085_c0_g1~~TRINITY_DN12085_c0_g1_i1.p1  ORF type:complete len:151 (+),score=31.93 TRINITY_DN12085_c0_g1_i1:96-548(+)